MAGDLSDVEVTVDEGEGASSAVRATEEVVRLVDGATRDRALVLGSLPPHGRDLDLLVSEGDSPRLTSAFRDAGLVAAGASWILFRGCAVVAIELADASSMALPDQELESLFREAVPVAGATRVVAPAPHHALLILARRLERAPRLEPKHRERIARAVAADPDAWSRARERAPAWTALGALGLLESRYDDASEASQRRRTARPRWTRTFSISGPDGAAVELHAHALRDALERLGYRAALVAGAPRRPGGGVARAPVLGALTATCALWASHLRQLGRADVVVFAGHALEHAVAAGRERPPAAALRAARLLGWSTPRPRRVYFLDCPAGDVRDLDAYRAAAEALGAQRVDASASTDTVCELVARDAWSALARRGRLEATVRRARAMAARARARTGPPR